MIRDTLNDNAINALVYVSPASGISYQGRTTTGGNTVPNGSAFGSAPWWIKLNRTGTTFTAYQSSDGSTWTQVGTSQTSTMSANAWIGLVVGSKNNMILNTSTFDNVTFTARP